MKNYELKSGKWRLEAWDERESSGYRLKLREYDLNLEGDDLHELYMLLRAGEVLNGGEP